MALAGVAILTVTSMYVYWKNRKDRSTHSKPLEAPKQKHLKSTTLMHPDLPIAYNTVVDILSDISDIMESFLIDLFQFEEMLNQDSAYSKEIIREKLNKTVEEKLELAEQAIYSKHKVSKEAMDTSIEILGNDSCVQSLLHRLWMLISMSLGIPCTQPELPSYMTVDKTTDITIEIMRKRIDTIEWLFHELSVSNKWREKELMEKLLNDRVFLLLFNSMYEEEMKENENQIYSAHKVNKGEFSLALLCHHSNPSFISKIALTSEDLHRRYEMLGADKYILNGNFLVNITCEKR